MYGAMTTDHPAITYDRLYEFALVDLAFISWPSVSLTTNCCVATRIARELILRGKYSIRFITDKTG